MEKLGKRYRRKAKEMAQGSRCWFIISKILTEGRSFQEHHSYPLLQALQNEGRETNAPYSGETEKIKSVL